MMEEEKYKLLPPIDYIKQVSSRKFTLGLDQKKRSELCGVWKR
jgi:hypothetical protein